MAEREVKIYNSNKEIFPDMDKKVLEAITAQNRATTNILDLGSDKPPQFALYMAQTYKNVDVTHFKDTKTMGKVDATYDLENLHYVFNKKGLKKGAFDVATAFFTIHEFPKQWRRPELNILKKSLKQSGKLIVIDYDLNWVKNEGISERDFTQYVFTDGNEKRVMSKEAGCMETHTALGLEDYVKEIEDSGFRTDFSEKYKINTPWGIKPKLFLYIGEYLLTADYK